MLSATIEIFDHIAMYLTEEGLLTSSECVNFLAFIKADVSL
jgi:hypothetical protein